ncbi:hypothetical protein ACJX0J_025121, partial [Zea mays]
MNIYVQFLQHFYKHSVDLTMPMSFEAKPSLQDYVDIFVILYEVCFFGHSVKKLFAEASLPSAMQFGSCFNDCFLGNSQKFEFLSYRFIRMVAYVRETYLIWFFGVNI